MVNDVDDAQDIVQEAFISAFENLSSFKGESKLSTWLYRIVMNKALAAKNKQRFFEEVDGQPTMSEEYDEDLDAEVVQNAQKALSVLGEKERFIIELFYYQEQSIREISEICMTSEANIKVMLHRSRKKMNDTLRKNTKFASNE